MKRFGDINELNGAVQFLCSDAASFVTGALAHMLHIITVVPYKTSIPIEIVGILWYSKKRR